MRPDRVRRILQDMLDEMEGIDTHLARKTFAEYSRNWVLKRAIERSIAIVSEASRRLPEELCASAPDVPWKEIRGIGNVLRHDYDDVVDQVIYRIATEKLPGLKVAILAMQAKLGKDD